jgi:hypothetical protein
MRRFGWAEEQDILSFQCRDKYVPTTTTVGLMQPESHGRHIRILS